MAYCKQCGAYIPDGLSACLACGYDEAAEQSKNSGAATVREQQNEDFRLKYEEERRKRQEENRRWAEQERQRQEEDRRRQEENRRWAEVERQRREQERQRQEAEERERRSRTYAYRAAGDPGVTGQGKNRILAALSYLSVLFVLPRFFCPEDEFARYHARQGLTLFIFGVICDALSAAVPIGWVLTLFRLYCIYKGMTNALNDRMEPLPYIGRYGEKN